MKVDAAGNCQDAPAAAVTSIPRSWRRWARSAAVSAPAELNAHPEGAVLGKAVLAFGTPAIPRSCARAIQDRSAEGSPLHQDFAAKDQILAALPFPGLEKPTSGCLVIVPLTPLAMGDRACGCQSCHVPCLAQCLYFLRFPRFPQQCWLAARAAEEGCLIKIPKHFIYPLLWQKAQAAQKMLHKEFFKAVCALALLSRGVSMQIPF